MMAEPRIDDRDRNVGAAQDLGMIPQLREQLEEIGFPILPHLMVTKQSFEGVLDVDQIMDCVGCVSSYYHHHILPDERVPTAHLQAPSGQRAALSRSLQPAVYADHATVRLRHRVHDSKWRAEPQRICLSYTLERSRDTGLGMEEVSGRSRMDQDQKDNHCAMGRPRRRCSGSL